MRDIFIFCLIFIGIILFYPFTISLLPLDISVATPFLLQSMILVFIWYQTIRRFEFQWKFQRTQPITQSFGLFVIVSLISVLFTVYRWGSLQYWSLYMTGFLLFLAVGNYQLKVLHEPEIELEFPQRQFRNSLLWMLFLYGLLQSLLGIYQYYIGFDNQLQFLRADPALIDTNRYTGVLHALSSKRITGTFGNPNLYSTVLAMLIPIGLGLICSAKKSIYKWIISLGIILMVYSIGLSSSRGGLLACILGITVFLILLDRTILRNHKQILVLIVLLSILAIFLPQFIQSEKSVETIGERMRSGSSTTQERFQYWKIAWDMFKDSPVLGSGLGSYGILYGQYKPVGIGESRYTHNIFLQTLTESGIIILIILLAFFLILIAYPLYRIKLMKRMDAKIQLTAFLSAIIAFGIDSLSGFGFYFHDIFYLFCILLGGLYASSNCEIIPEPSPGDILWRRQPNTQFLLITPGITLVLVIYWYTFIYNPFRGELEFQKGRNNLIAGQVEESIHYYNKAVALNPMNSEFHQHLGNTLILKGDSNKGIDELKMAVKLNPHTAYYHADLGEAYAQLNQLDKAIQEYNKAVQCYPNKAKYHISLLHFYQKRGDIENAEIEMEVLEKITKGKN